MKKLFVVILAIIPVICSAQYKISNEGRAFIKSYEGLSLTSYPDADGYSIGYGHHKPDIYEGMTITQKQAEKYFNDDIAEAERYANWLLNSLSYEYEFSQGFIDGLVSLVYNCGVGGVKYSTFYKRLKNCRVKDGVMNKSDFDWTMAAVKTMNISDPGHKSRRNEEYTQMVS